MPILANAKHERFAQEVAKGKTAEEAYKIAGYTPSLKNAQRLKCSEGILRRLAEIQSRASNRAEVTVASLINEAEEVRERALAAGQYAAAIAAIKEKGVLSGNRVEKRETTNRNINEMTDDELAAIARTGSTDAARPPGPSSRPH